MVRTIVGANWGDEGKGKVTDLLAEESDVVVRFQGGANAGHTIINEYGKFALHLLPSGVFHQNVVNVIGPGVALNIEALLSELESLTSRGVPMPKLMISDRCQVMMPYHIAFDKLEEERLGKSAFGSTKSGIAPFYSDKYAKVGIQVCQLYDEALLRKRLEIALVKKNVLLEHLYHQPPIDVNELVSYLQVWRRRFARWSRTRRTSSIRRTRRARPSCWKVSLALCAIPTTAFILTRRRPRRWRATAAWVRAFLRAT